MVPLLSDDSCYEIIKFVEQGYLQKFKFINLTFFNIVTKENRLFIIFPKMNIKITDTCYQFSFIYGNEIHYFTLNYNEFFNRRLDIICLLNARWTYNKIFQNLTENKTENIFLKKIKIIKFLTKCNIRVKTTIFEMLMQKFSLTTFDFCHFYLKTILFVIKHLWNKQIFYLSKDIPEGFYLTSSMFKFFANVDLLCLEHKYDILYYIKYNTNRFNNVKIIYNDWDNFIDIAQINFVSFYCIKFR